MKTENEIEATLRSIIEEAEDTEITRINTFEECGILTRDQGFVICMEDGKEFQVTIVRSR